MGIFGRDSSSTQHEPLETVVGSSASVKGHLRSDGGVRIDGAFEGVIEVAGNVVIGEGARVVADITARNVTVGGALKGDIDGTGRLEILSTGQVFGDITVEAVMIDEGGVFQGVSRMRGLEQRALVPPQEDGVAESEDSGVVDISLDEEALDVAARPAYEGDERVPNLDLEDIEPIIPDVVIEDAAEEGEATGSKKRKRGRSRRKGGDGK